MRFRQASRLLWSTTILVTLGMIGPAPELTVLPPQPSTSVLEAEPLVVPATTASSTPTSTTERKIVEATTTTTRRPSRPQPEPASQPTPQAPPAAPDPSGLAQLAIPAIGVQTSLPVGTYFNEDGNIEPPFQTAVMYSQASRPGQTGSTLIVAHVSSKRYGPDVFYNLGRMTPGDEVLIDTPQGRFTYQVTEVRVQDKPNFPWDELSNIQDRSTVWLVTCGGAFNYDTGHFVSNIIVRADQVG